MKNFFSHDEGARNDPKLIKVLMRLGQAGKGVYWDLVEMLYEQDGYLLLSECESYAFALRTDNELIQSLIADFGLFDNDGTRFWSPTALRRLSLRKGKSQKAAESANKRWKGADAMRTHNDGNAIKRKEKKVEESKVNEEEDSPSPSSRPSDEFLNITRPEVEPETKNSADSYFHFCAELKTKTMFRESCIMGLKIPAAQLDTLIDEFTLEVRGKENQYATFETFRDHCQSWLRIKSTYLSTQNPKSHALKPTPQLGNPFGQGADLSGIDYKQESFKPEVNGAA